MTPEPTPQPREIARETMRRDGWVRWIDLSHWDRVELSFAAALARAVAEERERCARIAETFTGGFTANIRITEDECELVRDPDGPWVLNSDIAAALRAPAGEVTP